MRIRLHYRVFFVVVATWVVAMSLVGLALKTNWATRGFRELVELHARYFLGIELDLTGFSVELFPPTLLIEHVVARDVKRGQFNLLAHRVRVGVRPWPSLRGQVVVAPLVASDVELEVRIQSDLGKFAGSLPFDLREAHVLWKSLHIVVNDTTLHSTSASLSVVPAEGAQKKVLCEVAQGVWTDRGQFHAVSARGEMLVRGRLDDPRVVSVQNLNIDTLGMALHISGEAYSLRQEPQLNLHMTAATNLEVLHNQFPQLRSWTGDVHLAVDMFGDRHHPVTRADIGFENLTWNGKAIGDVAMSLSSSDPWLEPKQMNVETLDLVAPAGAKIKARGWVTLPRGHQGVPDVSMDVMISSLPLGQLVRFFSGNSVSPVEGKVDGDVHVSARLGGSPVVQLQSNIQLAQFLFWNGKHTHKLVALPQSVVRGSMVVTRRAVDMQQMVVETGTSRVLVNGLLDYTEGYDLRAAADDLVVSDLGEFFFMHYDGVGNVAVAFEGPLLDPRISATADLRNLAIGNYTLGDTKATILWRDEVLELDRVDVRRGGGAANGRMVFSFSPQVPTLTGEVKFSGVEIRDWLSALHLGEPWVQRLHGATSGEIDLDGPVARPRGEILLDAPRLRIDESELGAAIVKSSFGFEEQQVLAEITLKQNQGQAKSRVVVHHNHNLDIEVQAVGIRLEPFFPLYDGVLDGSLHLYGDTKTLEGEGNAKVEGLRAYSLAIGTTDLTIVVRQGVVSGYAFAPQKNLEGQGSLGLHDDLPFVFDLTFRRMPFHEVLRLSRGTQLVLSGTSKFSGALRQPEKLRAQYDIAQGILRLGNTDMMLQEPATIVFSQGVFEGSDVGFVGGGTALKVSGVWSLDGETHLKLDARGGVVALAKAVPTIEFNRGQLRAHVDIRGQAKDLQYMGRVELTDGVVTVLPLNRSFQQAGFTADFSGRRIRLKGSAKTSEGNMQLQGDLILAKDLPMQVDVDMQFRHLDASPTSQVSLVASGDLSLSGPANDLLLGGAVRLESMRYTANLSLEKLIPRRSTPLQVPHFQPGHAVRLGIRVQAPGGMMLSSNVVDAELAGDIMITGTTERVGLVGSLTPVWARARYRDSSFEVERATLDFTEEYRVFAQFDVRAKTRACRMDAVVEIQGNSDRYTVTPSGNDEQGIVPPQDVLACLQLGTRLKDVLGRDAARVGNFLPSGLDAVWAVSGMDEKIRRVLPFPVVDELRLTSAWSVRDRRTSPAVVLGKGLGDRVRAKYTVLLDQNNEQNFTMEYQLFDGAAVQGSWANTAVGVSLGDVGLDLKLNWEFQ